MSAIVRKLQLDQLQKSVKSIGYIVATTSQEDATAYRDGGDGWTVLEVVGHLFDYEPIMLQRATMTVEQDYPELPFPDPDELVAAGNYNAQSLADVYRRWAEQRKLLLDYLADRSESDWARPARHPVRGDFPLSNQLALIGWHDINHLEQICHILTEKKGARQA